MTTRHVVEPKTYIIVFSALIVLTLTTVGVATVDLGPMNTVAALSIAAVKAALVTLYFMHVRYSKPLIVLVIFAAVLWLAILIGLTMSDFVSRPWIPAPRGF
jgi:cytochrome c oxidase subunit IV